MQRNPYDGIKVRVERCHRGGADLQRDRSEVRIREVEHAPPRAQLDEQLAVPRHELDLIARSSTKSVADRLRHRDLTLAGQTCPPAR